MVDRVLNRSHFKKSKKIQVAFTVLFAFFLSVVINKQVLAEEYVSVGVVNVAFLMENAPQAEQASIKLKKVFSPQESKLANDLELITKLERELNEIKIANESLELRRSKERELRTKRRSRSRELQDFREELRFARDAALDGVQKEVFRAIDKVRTQKNIDIVLQDYISASKKVDITAAVLEYLNEKIVINADGAEPTSQLESN